MAGFIFPTSIYGRTGDVYGTNITQYANSQGFPPGSGLVLGQFGVLFDGTVCRLLTASAGIVQFAAVTVVIGNSNANTVVTTSAAEQPVIAVNDRAGSTALVANNIAWMTTYGLGTALIAASQTANKAMVSTTTAGTLSASTAGTDIFNNVILLNTSTTLGGYPVLLQ